MPPKATAPAAAAPALCFDLPPLPPERIAFPAPYAEYWADVRLDPPEREVVALTTKAEVLARVVTSWNLRLADGSPAPRTEAAFAALLEQAAPLLLWLYDEWQTRRSRPLGAPPTPTNGHSSPPPTT